MTINYLDESSIRLINRAFEKNKSDFLSENGGRRSGIDRREFSYTAYVPERRNGIDRRSGLDRRKKTRDLFSATASQEQTLFGESLAARIRSSGHRK